MTLDALADVATTPRQVLTSTSGDALFPDIALGSYRIMASCGDCSASAKVVVRSGEGARVTLRMVDSEPGAFSTTVVVSDEHGHPKVGCRVAAVGFGVGRQGAVHVADSLVAHSDSLGVARLDGIAFERALFTVSGGGRPFRCFWQGQRQSAHPRADIGPKPTGVLSGVVRLAGSMPAADQAIVVYAVGNHATDGFSEQVTTVRTTAQGSFELSLEPGAYYLATPAGDPRVIRRSPQTLHDGEEIADTVDLSVVRVQSADVSRVELEVVDGVTLVGSVLSADGGAVPDIELQLVQIALPPLPERRGGIRVRPPNDDWQALGALADMVRRTRVTAGRFAVGGLRPGLWVVRAADSHFAIDEVCLRISADSAEVTLSGGARGELRGSATPGSCVVLRRLPATSPVCVAEVGGDGQFQCADLPCGDYVAVIADVSAEQTVRIAPGESRFVDLRNLSAPRGLMTGYVVGLPATSDVSVSMSGLAGQVVGNSFEFQLNQPFVGRPNLLAVYAHRGATYEWEVDMVPCDVPTALHRADVELGQCSVVLRTRDPMPESGSVTVRSRSLSVQSEEVWRLHLQGRFDRDGLLELEMLHAGVYSANVVWPDGRQARREFSVPALEAVELICDTIATHRVCVRDSVGRPVSGFGVVIAPYDGKGGSSRVEALMNRAQLGDACMLTDIDGIVNMAVSWGGRSVIGCGPIADNGELSEIMACDILEPASGTSRPFTLSLKSASAGNGLR